MAAATPTEGDLNQIIVSAVNARVEAQVLAALSGDEVISKYVTAALSEKVLVNPNDRYSHDKERYLTHVLRAAIKDAAKAAVAKLIVEETPLIEEEIRKALRRDIRKIGETLAGTLAARAAEGYGVTVQLNMPGDRY